MHTVWKYLLIVVYYCMTVKRQVLELYFKGYTQQQIYKMDITPSKKYINSILVDYRSNKKYASISKRSLETMIGTILGDAHISNRAYTPVFSFRHQKDHKEYLNHKVNIINLSHKVSNTDQYRKKTLCEGYTAVFHAHPIFKKLRQIFYPDGNKIFPKEYCNKYLDWEGLCYWFLDDGCTSSHSCNLAIFNFQDQAEEIQQFLKYKFDLPVNIQAKGNQLYIPTKERNRFFTNIENFIPNCMKYKIKRSL